MYRQRYTWSSTAPLLGSRAPSQLLLSVRAELASGLTLQSQSVVPYKSGFVLLPSDKDAVAQVNISRC